MERRGREGTHEMLGATSGPDRGESWWMALVARPVCLGVGLLLELGDILQGDPALLSELVGGGGEIR